MSIFRFFDFQLQLFTSGVVNFSDFEKKFQKFYLLSVFSVSSKKSTTYSKIRTCCLQITCSMEQFSLTHCWQPAEQKKAEYKHVLRFSELEIQVPRADIYVS